MQTGDYRPLDTHWKRNTANCKQSRNPGIPVSGDGEPKQKKGSAGPEVRAGSSLGCSNHVLVEFSIC